MALKAEIRKKGFDSINRSLSGLREVPVELYKDYSAQQALTHAVRHVYEVRMYVDCIRPYSINIYHYFTYKYYHIYLSYILSHRFISHLPTYLLLTPTSHL